VAVKSLKKKNEFKRIQGLSTSHTVGEAISSIIEDIDDEIVDKVCAGDEFQCELECQSMLFLSDLGKDLTIILIIVLIYILIGHGFVLSGVYFVIKSYNNKYVL